MGTKKAFHYACITTYQDGHVGYDIKRSIKSNAADVLLNKYSEGTKSIISGPLQTGREAREILKKWEQENTSQCERCEHSFLESSFDWDGFCRECSKKVRCRICEKYIDTSEVWGWVCNECFDAAKSLRRKPTTPHWTKEYIDWNDKSIPVGKRKVVFVKWLMQVKKLKLEDAKRVCHRKFAT